MYNPSELRDIVDKTLINLTYNTEVPRLIDPVKYILSLGGKRIRPVMALMACNLFNDKIDDAVFPASGLEIFHNFTLVHDDIMDKAPVRRGFPTVHSKWDLNQAVLSGDVMSFIANECFMLAPSHLFLKIFRVFNKAAIEVCVGQQLDMDYEKSLIVTENEYLRMIELKTAVLIAASLRIGALIGGGSDKDSDLLYDFGRNLGLAFQIQDDILDIWGDTKIFGKTRGGDIVSNKKTFPFIKAMEIATGETRKQLQILFSGNETEPDVKIRKVTELYDQLNIRGVSESLANDYIDKAFQFLLKVNVDDKRKKELTNLAGSLIGRSH
jgi:geranylgeranyl diphosphate synthase type II